MTDKKMLIFIPTYNERDNVTPLWQGIAALGLDADVLFIDDSSPDGTGEILDALAAQNPRLTILHRAGKLGIGTAHQAGIAYAYDHGYELLVTMDADFTHSPENIPMIIQRLGDSDVAVGSRYLQNNSLEGWSLWRKFLTGLAHVLTTLLLDLKYDSTGAFRIYRLDRIPRELFSLMESKGYSFFFESLHVLNFNKFKIEEMPISLPPRVSGSSKMSYRDMFRSLEMLFRSFLKRIFMRSSLRIHPEHAVKACTAHK